MFKFLKEKLKSAISKISEGVEKEGKVEEKIIEKPAEEEKKQEKGFFAKLKERIVGKEEVIEEERKEPEGKPEIEKKPQRKSEAGVKEHAKIIEHKEQKKPKEIQQPVEIKKEKPEYKKSEAKAKLPEKKEEKVEIEEKLEERKHRVEIKKEDIKPRPQEKPIITKKEEPEKKGFFASIKERIITTKIDEGQFEKLFWELELALMENNVAVEVIEKIKDDLKEELVEKPIRRTKVEETVEETLKGSIESLFQTSGLDLIEEIKGKKEKPYVIAFFGINGSGKTTSIAKIAYMLKEMNMSSVLAASDTFRAASIEQLQLHADKIGIKLIKHDYGSDPAAVAFDAIKHARAKNIDVVLIDTAGRMHSNQNLIDELKKITRVTKPDLKIFVGESIAGNDCVNQATEFNEAVGIDAIILAKADVDEKGGAAISVSYVTKKPIIYLGTGQNYSDLKRFDSEIIVKNLGLG